MRGGNYNQYGDLIDSNPYSHKLTQPAAELYSCFLEANKGLATETDRMEECGWWPIQGMHTRWVEIGVEDCEALINSKVDLQIYHGDISDLVEDAPVDLLYLSNALAYSGRNGKDFKLGEIVEKGALVAWTVSAGYGTTTAKTVSLGGLTIKPVERIKPKARSSSLSLSSTSAIPPATALDGGWEYNLAEVV